MFSLDRFLDPERYECDGWMCTECFDEVESEDAPCVNCGDNE